MLPARFAIFALVFTVGACAVHGADGADEVKEKLFQAKKDYDAEAQKFRKTVIDALEKREDAARKAGDKKALDAVKVDRDRFDKTGEAPTDTPKALQTQIGAARAKLDKAYAAAVRDLVKLKEDAAAEAIEKEQQKFFVESAVQFGKKTYLVTLKHYDLKVPGGWFSNDGTLLGHKIKKDGELVPHSIFLHAFDKGSAQVKYSLGGRWQALHATVGVPTVEDDKPRALTGLTFEVLGDGKSLWKSEPVTKSDEYQTCAVRIEKVKVLTLQVNAGEKGGRSVWFEPILIE